MELTLNGHGISYGHKQKPQCRAGRVTNLWSGKDANLAACYSILRKELTARVREHKAMFVRIKSAYYGTTQTDKLMLLDYTMRL
jgi:hypothetical protein